MEIVRKEPLFKRHLTVTGVVVKSTPEASERTLEVVERRDAVAALVFDPARQGYLLVEQWRVGAEADLLELPAGLIDAGETPEAALRRELAEELGVTVGELTPIATFYPSPGFSAEQIHLFYAEADGRIGEGGGLAEEDEHLTIRTLSLEALWAAEVRDGKTLIALHWLRNRLKQ